MRDRSERSATTNAPRAWPSGSPVRPTEIRPPNCACNRSSGNWTSSTIWKTRRARTTRRTTPTRDLAGAGRTTSPETTDALVQPAALRIPVPFEVFDQRRAEVAVGLLERVQGEIAPEQIERLLRNAESAPVRAGADHARTGQPLHDALDRAVHVASRDHLVADQPPLGAVALEPALGHDRLARNAVPGEARQAQVGRAGDDALLAGGQAHECVLRREHVVHDEQVLAVPADGESLHHRDPGFLPRCPGDVVRRRVRARETPIDLVDDPQVALQVPDERHLALVQMREVDAAAEHAAPLILAARYGVPAQHADLRLRIEDRQIDRDLGRVHGARVLGGQMARVLLDHVRGLAFAEDFRRAEIDAPILSQLRKPLGGSPAGQPPRVAKVAPGGRIRGHRGAEEALIDLQSFLVALQERGLGRDLRARRSEPGHERGRIVYELLDANESRALLREPVIGAFHVGGEKAGARVARRLLDLLGRLRLVRVARGLRGQAREPRRAALPESRVARAVAGEIAGIARRFLSSGCFSERQVLDRLSMTRTALPCER